MEEKDNLALWNRRRKTNKAHIKEQGYGANLSAINPQSQIMAATEEWGQYGANWGLRDLKFTEYTTPERIFWRKRKVEGKYKDYEIKIENCLYLVKLDAEFWYRNPDLVGTSTTAPLVDNKRSSFTSPASASVTVSSFPITVEMDWEPGQETFKKLQTMARSKAFSYLGFNADVFLNEWDGQNKKRAVSDSELEQIKKLREETRKMLVQLQQFNGWSEHDVADIGRATRWLDGALNSALSEIIIAEEKRYGGGK